MDKTVISDWRLKGHKFADIPPHIQGLARDKLRIPTDVKSVIPHPKMSVLDLVIAKLPPVNQTEAVSVVPSTHSFFSPEEPSPHYLDILESTAVPPRATLANLLAKATQQWADGANSISVPGAVGYLPLWALQIWTDIHQIVLPAQTGWKAAIAWLQRNEIQQFGEPVHSTFQSLSTLSWSGPFVSASQGNTSFTKSSLLTYLSRNWATDEHIDQMVHLLKIETKTAQPKRDLHFMDTIMVRRLIQAHDDDHTGKVVYDPFSNNFLSVFGSKLTQRSELGGIFHINNNHWIAIVIDINSEELLYGDPVRSAPDSGVITALRWFISKHLPSLPFDQLDEEILPTPLQDFQKDWFNCAFFSYSALLHYFIPEQPLLQNTDNPAFSDLARLGVLRKLIATHNSILLHDHALPSKVFEGRQKTFERINPMPRPVTPPPPHSTSTTKHMLTSPQKPKSKKSKTDGGKIRKPSKSVVAPIFQREKAAILGPKALEYQAKLEVKNEPLIFSQPLKLEEGVPETDDEVRAATEDEKDINTQGRPRLGVLDKLTVEVSTKRGEPRKYRCSGAGCSKTWQPRSRVRVLAHSKGCLFSTSSQRALAAAASAEQSPGALVASSSSDSVVTILGPSSLKRSQSTPAAAASVSDSSQPLNIVPSRPAPSLLPRSDSLFFGTAARKSLHQALDLAIVKLFCVGKLAPTIVDLPEWKNIFALSTPSYAPASQTKLMDNHIMSEQENVRMLQIQELKTHRRLSISFDGGSIRCGESFYTVNATTGDLERKVMLLEGQECTNISHTGEWIADLVFRVMDSIGMDKFIAVSADNTGNTRVAREIIAARLPNVLNLPDPEHHLNNTWKDIASIDFFKVTVKRVRGIIKYFKHSNQSKALLKDLREQMGTGPGLESIGKTRFATLAWAALSVKRCLPAIRELCNSGQINIPKYNDLFVQTMETLHFELSLTQFVSVGEGFARTIECLEATATSPSDVFLYWLALVARLKESLETCSLPGSVCDEIRGIVKARWNEFFVEGPTNVHLSAFYLNPSYVRSSIFKNPNPLAFSIVLPGKQPPLVPLGIRNPKTFLEVGKYLHSLLVTEVNYGENSFLTGWKDRPQAFTKLYQEQFTAYAQGSYPFSIPLGPGQSALQWWLAFEDTPNAGILAAIAIKLHSAVPHAIAEERTMSAITMLNSAQRNRQTVSTVVAMTQVGGYYKAQRPSRVRKSARPNPVIKFFDIERLLRPIENESRGDTNPNYDESDDDDEDTDLVASDSGKSITPTTPSTSFPTIGNDDDINIASDELREILSDEPLGKKVKVTNLKLSQLDLASDGVAEDNTTFELLSWV